MSSGHHDVKVNEKHYAELLRISRTPWFKQGLAIPKQLVRSAQIPWLGGSSTDLRRIYLDPRFAGPVRYKGHNLDARIFVPPLVQHEGVEGICLVLGRDEAGKPYSYDGAHELATAAEEAKARQIVVRLGLQWDRGAYQAIFKPFLKLTVKPPWQNLPADLNTEPYRDDDPALYRAIERAQLQGAVRDNQARMTQ